VTHEEPGALPALVIFDCDGVLVDSEPIANRVLAAMLSEEGLAMDMAEARRTYQGWVLSDVARDAEEKLGRDLPRDWLARYEAQRSVAFRADLAPVAGAEFAVRAVIAAGVEACVASQGRLEKTALSLELAGLEELLPPARRFSAEQVPRGKPHPDLFLHATHTLGVEPGDCVVVEDTAIGVRAAVSAGMRAIGYVADADAQAIQAAGGELMASMLELPARLGIAEPH
jgi:HAD superfamily hydrolase (TIGR01509 family)